MTVTVLSDVVMPDRVVQAGVRGRQMRSNHRVRVDSGREYINIGWSKTLREYDLGIVPLVREIWQDIETLHEITEGGAYGFLMPDPKDADVLAGEGVAADLGDGEYQLYKRYLYSVTRYKDRVITRPIASRFSLYISGVLQTTGFTLDDETGIVTIASAPAASTVTWTGRFYVPVHFQSDTIDWEIVAPGPSEESRYIAASCVLQEIRE
jgi:uncharacterized protein (TIGR02217 family)